MDGHHRGGGESKMDQDRNDFVAGEIIELTKNLAIIGGISNCILTSLSTQKYVHFTRKRQFLSDNENVA